MELTTKDVLVAMLEQKKAPVVRRAVGSYPTGIVLGIWTATAFVLLYPGRKPHENELLKAYSIVTTLLPLV